MRYDGFTAPRRSGTRNGRVLAARHSLHGFALLHPVRFRCSLIIRDWILLSCSTLGSHSRLNTSTSFSPNSFILWDDSCAVCFVPVFLGVFDIVRLQYCAAIGAKQPVYVLKQRPTADVNFYRVLQVRSCFCRGDVYIVLLVVWLKACRWELPR